MMDIHIQVGRIIRRPRNQSVRIGGEVLATKLVDVWLSLWLRDERGRRTLCRGALNAQHSQSLHHHGHMHTHARSVQHADIPPHKYTHTHAHALWLCRLSGASVHTALGCIYRSICSHDRQQNRIEGRLSAFVLYSVLWLYSMASRHRSRGPPN